MQEYQSCQLNDVDVDMDDNKEELSFIPDAVSTREVGDWPWRTRFSSTRSWSFSAAKDIQREESVECRHGCGESEQGVGGRRRQAKKDWHCCKRARTCNGQA